MDAVLLDMGKSLDTGWQKDLLFKLAYSPLSLSNVNFLRSHFGDIFSASVNGFCPTVRPVTAGVPQGFVLSPYLYLVNTNYFAALLEAALYVFADAGIYNCNYLFPRFGSIKL